MREIALEISIIVFAVTLSFWLHGLGEHRHEQQQVKSFLLRLKRDIPRLIRKGDMHTSRTKYRDHFPVVSQRRISVGDLVLPTGRVLFSAGNNKKIYV